MISHSRISVLISRWCDETPPAQIIFDHRVVINTELSHHAILIGSQFFRSSQNIEVKNGVTEVHKAFFL